ncbi:YbhB/YbcL family Raf kinase inhibitor-like protein [Candidatus Woesearchaeota archaeon]|nr:YbhB/YbcL family Raf kinase inhibitor-like protein [Candidatus Woesearchaeota archaeon]
MELNSPAFAHNTLIPTRFTCQGEDMNPPLEITNLPTGTKSLVLIVDDPDAPGGNWDHWVVWNIPPTTTLEEDEVPEGAVEGINDFGKHTYGGPCPPKGTHRYFFKLFALDTILALPEASGKQEVLAAMQGHILADATLVGLYHLR